MSPKLPWRDRWDILRRHPAFQAVIVVATGGWLALQAADVFELPTAAVRALGLVLMGVVVLLLVYAWVDAGRQQVGEAGWGSRFRFRAVAAVGVTLIVLSAAAWWARPRLFGGVVAPGADVIAVLPFTTTGASVGLLGEGMVDLLSANLNEVGDIRTINPRTTLSRWRQATEGGAPDLEGSLAVGRSLGAGSVLLGSVVEAGANARVRAELYDLDGEVLAQVETDGPPEDVLALVDALSAELIREIWRSREPLPDLRVSAITSSSVPALRAYLRGEQFYRASQWDSARASFARAVEEDSLFALAQYRLGESYGWTESLGSAAAQRYSATAARLAERLPLRERSLVVAHRLHEDGDLAAIDSLRAYVARFPDDVEGWHLLADAQYHAQTVLALTDDDVYAAYDRVLALDSSFSPALSHPVEHAVLRGDSAAFRRYRAAAEGRLPADMLAEKDVAADLLWGPADADARRFAAAFRKYATRSPTSPQQLLGAAARGASGTDDGLEAVLAAFDSAREIVPQAGPQIQAGGVQLLALHGRTARAEAALEEVRAVSPPMAAGIASGLVAAGMTTPEFAERHRSLLAGAPTGDAFATYGSAVVALSSGNADPASGHVAELRRNPGSAPRRVPDGIVDALAGWMTLARGDTAAAARTMKAGLVAAGYAPFAVALGGSITLALAEAQVALPEFREEGVRRLRLVENGDPFGVSLILYERLGRAYERAGAVDDARRIYATVLALWTDVDPSFKPRVDAARRALQRLSPDATS